MIRTGITRGLPVSAALLALVAATATAQEIPTPLASPAASVSQTIGLTKVEVTYHRPAVKGRELWGGLVPYWELWRAGANENTTFACDTDVLVEGQPLPAGTYGLHMIPGPDAWEIVFSTNASAWGSYFYVEDEDALRVSVTPRAAPHEEWLAYAFGDLAGDAATLSLHWGELLVPIRVSVDLPEVTFRKLRDEHLRNLAGFGWRGWYDAAGFLVEHGIHLDYAERWIARSVSMNPNFSNQWLAAAIHDAAGRGADAGRARAAAIESATEDERDALAAQYLAGGRLREAITLLEQNAAKHPASWRAHDRLAGALAKDGQTERALQSYHRAIELAQDGVQRTRIDAAIAELQG